MYNSKLFIQLVFFVCGITLCAIAGSVLLVTGVSAFGGCICLVLIVFQMITLINLLNTSNRKIADFFASVHTHDSTIRYPEQTSDPYLRKLYTAMNRLTSVIREGRIELEQKTQYYESILHQLPVGIILADEPGLILFINPAARRLLQYSALTRMDQLDRIENGFFALFTGLASGQHQLIKLTNERESKSLSLVATTIQVREKTVRLYTLQNIRKELDEKEGESWIRLIRILTHEIMNSITPLTSLSHDLLKHINLNTKDQLREGLEVIHEQGEALITFINSYHRLTHLPAPQKELFPVKDLFNKVSLLLCAEPGKERVFFTNPATVTIYADKNLITLVLINLIKNALQATAGTPAGRIEIEAFTPPQFPFIKVTDNGKGIEAHIQEEIFVPFFTTRTGGSGIGLSVSRQIMRLHGGSLTVKSSVGEGATFKMEF